MRKTGLALFLLAMLPNIALAINPVSLHLGADYKHFGARPRAEYRPTFPELHEGSDLYAGVRLGDWKGWDWGVNVGWERSSMETERTTLPNNHLFFNRLAQGGDLSHVETRFQGWYSDLMIYKNLVPCYLDFILTGGVAFQRPHANIYYTPAATGITEDYYVNNDSKTIGRIGFGAQWMLLKGIGIRGLVTWSNDNRYVYNGQQFNPASGNIERFEAHPYKSSMGLHIGFVARTAKITEWPDFKL
jgi:hypothetical protein